jgi:exopolysaccharide production protein ExoY
MKILKLLVALGIAAMATSASGSVNQSASVPENGATVMMLGAALIGTALFQRAAMLRTQGITNLTHILLWLQNHSRAFGSCLLLAVFSLAAVSALAVPVQVTFSGTANVSDSTGVVPTAVLGSHTFTGSFSYETSTLPSSTFSNGTTSSAQYSALTTPVTVTLDGGYVFVYNGYIRVMDDDPNFFDRIDVWVDNYIETPWQNFSTFGRVTVSDPTSAELTSAALPTQFQLADWPNRALFLRSDRVQGEELWIVSGQITSLSSNVVSAVPDAGSTASLFLAAIGTVVIVRGRSRASLGVTGYPNTNVAAYLLSHLRRLLGFEIRIPLFRCFSTSLPAWKRCIDLVCCILALPVFGGTALLAIIITKVGSPGPILFKQERVGYLGRRFTLYKFRTMHVRASSAAHQRHLETLIGSGAAMQKLDAEGDTRLIPGGWLLRATGIDELPQIINVLRGEMSIVGPRPCVPYEFDKYTPEQRTRFASVPGLTGLWQVSGKNRTTFEEMVQLDIRYSASRSLSDDIEIILRTLPALCVQVFEMRQARRCKAADAGKGGLSIATG